MATSCPILSRTREMVIVFFSEECITEELINVFFMTPIQYNWKVSLDKFMMNADIKLFWMELGYTAFDDLNEKEVCTCFE